MTEGDLDAVSSIYASHVGEQPPLDWQAQSLLSDPSRSGVTLVACDADGTVIGYVVGEVRTWEFGSPPAGWIIGLGVAKDRQREGIARRLLDGAVPHLARLGARYVRTMAKRDDVAVLRLFRSAGFNAGPYTELELELG